MIAGSDSILTTNCAQPSTIRVSLASDGSQGNGFSAYPAISGDGRYIAFVSGASNLVPNNTNELADIFVHDQQTGQTKLISIAADAGSANESSYDPDISADGRYVVFNSWATNLVQNDTNNDSDIFVYDQLTEETRRISVASDGTEANCGSSKPAISSDGRFVSFSIYRY